MKNTLMIATVAALALGVGSAMAQEGPMPDDYWAAKNRAAVTQPQAAPQSVGTYRSFLLHARLVDNGGAFVGGEGGG